MDGLKTQIPSANYETMRTRKQNWLWSKKWNSQTNKSLVSPIKRWAAWPALTNWVSSLFQIHMALFSLLICTLSIFICFLVPLFNFLRLQVCDSHVSIFSLHPKALEIYVKNPKCFSTSNCRIQGCKKNTQHTEILAGITTHQPVRECN